jgi:hypothetical protein
MRLFAFFFILFLVLNSQTKIEEFKAFEIIHHSFLEKVNFQFDKQISSNFFLKVKNSSINNDEQNLLVSYFNSGDKIQILKQLRLNKDLHDFVFYYGALERFKQKEYYKSKYNLEKSNSLGIYNEKLIELSKNLASFGFKPDVSTRIENIRIEHALKTKNEWSFKENLVDNSKQVEDKDIIALLNENILFISPVLFFLLVFIGVKLIRSKEAFIEEFQTENDFEDITTHVSSLRSPNSNSEKFNQILEKAKKTKTTNNIEDKLIMAEASLVSLEKRINYENEISFNEKNNDKQNQYGEYNIGKIQFSSGELELAINLQNIKKRTDLHRSKYQKIKPMLETKKSNNEIAKELGISINEVEMYLNFSSAS